MGFRELQTVLRGTVILWTAPYLEIDAAAARLNVPIEHVLGRPVRGDHLRMATSLSLEIGRLSRGVTPPELTNLFGASPHWEPVKASFRAVASTELRVLMLGESGTGKSALARAIHEKSARAKQPFINADLTGVPESLQMDALFGHVKGGYTAAGSDRAGLFRRADRGTLFLDEVCELKPQRAGRALAGAARKNHHARGIGREYPSKRSRHRRDES